MFSLMSIFDFLPKLKIYTIFTRFSNSQCIIRPLDCHVQRNHEGPSWPFDARKRHCGRAGQGVRCGYGQIQPHPGPQAAPQSGAGMAFTATVVPAAEGAPRGIAVPMAARHRRRLSAPFACGDGAGQALPDSALRLLSGGGELHCASGNAFGIDRVRGCISPLAAPSAQPAPERQVRSAQNPPRPPRPPRKPRNPRISRKSRNPPPQPSSHKKTVPPLFAPSRPPPQRILFFCFPILFA